MKTWLRSLSVLALVVVLAQTAGAREVVLLGDSIRLGYGPKVKEILKARGDHVYQLAGKVDAIDDLNAFVKEHGLAEHYADIVHFKPEGNTRLAEEVVRVLDAVK